MSRPLTSIVVAAICFIIPILIVSARYYQSAAFERPIHLSLFVLILSGALLHAWSGTKLHQTLPRQTGRVPGGHVSRRFAPGLTQIMRLFKSFRLSFIDLPSWMVLLIVSRTLLFWRTIRTVHCSWDGLENFVPLVTLILGVPHFQLILPTNIRDTLLTNNKPIRALARDFLLILVWGAAAAYTNFITECTTGAICPYGLFERLTPFMQAGSTFIDGLLLVLIARLSHQSKDPNQTNRLLAHVLLASGTVLAVLSVGGSLTRANSRWSVLLTRTSMRDIFLDGTLLSCALLAGTYLLGSLDPTLVALLATTAAILSHIGYKVYTTTWSVLMGSTVGVGLFIGAALIIDSLWPIGPGTRRSDASSNTIKVCAFSLFALSLVSGATYLRGQKTLSQPPGLGDLIATSRTQSNVWISAAQRSTTLQEATQEYHRRYGMPPPPNFDKWYEYATSLESSIIDDFTQIHTDLLPFWGVPPALLRERTTYLLEYPALSVGGLIIHDGRIIISPHVRGTHRWMLEKMESMIEPFAQWLPDMQLAFNLDDECRVSVPYNDFKTYKEEGVETQKRLATQSMYHGFEAGRHSIWPSSSLILDETQSEQLWQKKSSYFENWSKSPIFSHWVAPTCAADAQANIGSWWNRKAKCPWCAAPHTINGLVSNWTLSGDLCHQPDLAYLHGFLSSPSAMASTHDLFPLFSQSRLSNFADIVYPSPWNFGEKVQYDNERSIPWQEKLNSVFWRGASSDGFAQHGAWQGFLRARFVHASQKVKALLDKTTTQGASSPKPLESPSSSSVNYLVLINVSFVGDFSRCDERDCVAEKTVFYGSSTADPPPSVDFQEHWHHRHLFDLDGAGFSGRFLPFIESASLPYRVALFRTWWEERVHAWRHFVPVDTRLHELYDLFTFFGGRGEEEGARIAAEGSEWARKVLRKEDMQIYMFRLLLEWGRVVDDQREELGFVM